MNTLNNCKLARRSDTIGGLCLMAAVIAFVLTVASVVGGCQVAVAPGHGWGVGLLTDVNIDVMKVDAKAKTVESVHYGRTVDGPALGTAAMMAMKLLPMLMMMP